MIFNKIESYTIDTIIRPARNCNSVSRVVSITALVWTFVGVVMPTFDASVEGTLVAASSRAVLSRLVVLNIAPMLVPNCSPFSLDSINLQSPCCIRINSTL